MKSGKDNLTHDNLWDALKLFSEGGLYEAKLVQADTSDHPNFDFLFEKTDTSEIQPIPEMVKHLVDFIIPVMAEEKWDKKGTWVSEFFHKLTTKIMFHLDLAFGLIQVNLVIDHAFEGSNTVTTFEHYFLEVPHGKTNGMGSFEENGKFAYSPISEDVSRLNELKTLLVNKIEAKFLLSNCHNPRQNL